MVKSTSHIETQKNKTRRKILQKLHSQGASLRSGESEDIKEKLFKEESFKRAKTIMVYVSKDYEVDTAGIIEGALKLGKKVAVPVTVIKEKRLIPSEIKGLKGCLQKGAFGVYEPKKEEIAPIPTQELDLVVVPGIAFDKKGNRIGHGKGYFDIFLKNLKAKTPTIGLAFRCQLVSNINTLSNDIPVTKVITA